MFIPIGRWGIGLGYTRVVFVGDRYAYKLAQVRPLRTLLVAILAIFSSGRREVLAKRYHAEFFPALWRYLFAGLYANRAEMSYWDETQDERCVPIVGARFGGMLVVQPRAEPMSIEQVKSSGLATMLDVEELTTSSQYGLYRGVARIVDYAHWRTWPSLMPGE